MSCLGVGGRICKMSCGLGSPSSVLSKGDAKFHRAVQYKFGLTMVYFSMFKIVMSS